MKKRIRAYSSMYVTWLYLGRTRKPEDILTAYIDTLYSAPEPIRPIVPISIIS